MYISTANSPQLPNSKSFEIIFKNYAKGVDEQAILGLLYSLCCYLKINYTSSG